MNIRKFTASTSRQALKDIRNELGDDAVILSNRKVGDGVEIIAVASAGMEQLTDKASVQVAQLQRVEQEMPAHKPAKAANRSVAQTRSSSPVQAEHFIDEQSVPSVNGHDNILGEIKSMHSMLRNQLDALSWNDMQKRDPQRSDLLCRLLNSGFSASLARQMLDKMPAGDAQGESWVKQVLKRNLQTIDEPSDIVTRGGVYALIGPTGVGKTTTTAKLAARAVVRYGADKVALLTTDSYRIGAYEQLKIYGKILGVPVHAVKDTDDLRLTLSALRHKHLVLIDTVGMGQRDERVADQNQMFDAMGVERLLLLNATSGGDTLEEVVRMYHSAKVIGCIATKLDEAATLGALLDVLVRHRLAMHFMTSGQRVPEDLHPVNMDYLLHRALKQNKERSPFTLNDLDFPLVMAGASSMEAAYAL
jgi:flagellar biosynthesis protein FlhF